MTDTQIFEQFATLGLQMMGKSSRESRQQGLDELIPHLDSLDVDVAYYQDFGDLEQFFRRAACGEDRKSVSLFFYKTLLQYIGMDYSLRQLNALDALSKIHPSLQNFYKVLMTHPEKCASLVDSFKETLSQLDITRRHVAGLDAAIAFHEYMIAMCE